MTSQSIDMCADVKYSLHLSFFLKQVSKVTGMHMEDAVRTQHAARKPITVSQGLEVGVRLRKLPQTTALLEGDVRYVRADSSQSK